jgi:hypothetical protein
VHGADRVVEALVRVALEHDTPGFELHGPEIQCFPDAGERRVTEESLP